MTKLEIALQITLKAIEEGLIAKFGYDSEEEALKNSEAYANQVNAFFTSVYNNVGATLTGDK